MFSSYSSSGKRYCLRPWRLYGILNRASLEARGSQGQQLGLGESLMRLQVLSPLQYKHNGLFPQIHLQQLCYLSGRGQSLSLSDITQYSQKRVIGSTQIWEFEKLWAFLELASLYRLTKTVGGREISSREIYYYLLLSEHWSYQVLKMSSWACSSHPFP